MRRLAVLLLLTSSAAIAQPAPDKVWTPAPVSPLSTTGTVAPADRAGSGSARTSDAGPDSSAPFSGLPSGLGNSQSSTSSGDATPGTDSPTPNLSR